MHMLTVAVDAMDFRTISIASFLALGVSGLTFSELNQRTHYFHGEQSDQQSYIMLSAHRGLDLKPGFHRFLTVQPYFPMT